ncbi:hypothetical protein G7047_10265 [Diaphorobacter sp. HDW4A]|uniref:hypothetical protein n=1 Tax=Diaphorobacter sp. HDW4A TaxID=2714924 RepID=UPI0014098C9C|nr:hypothetical protein [Diaphorobacter sp. HDW4A]QIL80243.1 hypothetical protein G7047_10265 [Diaphorobacter sp. HDW4A]
MLKRSPTPEQLAGDDPAVLAAIARSRKLLKNRALIAAVAGAVPIPGLDWATQAALLSRIIPKINAEFGLTPQQLDELSPEKRQSVQNAVAIVGSALIGKFVTREMVLRLAKLVGMRMTTAQAAKYVPLAGQAVSAALNYATLRLLGEQHLRECVQVVQAAQLSLPPSSGSGI